MAIRTASSAAVLLQRPQNEPVELTLFHDVLCAWSAVADARLDELREEFGAVTRWSRRPFPLRSVPQLPDRKERLGQARTLRKAAKEPEGRLLRAELWTGDDAPVCSLPALVALEAALPQGEALQTSFLVALRRAALHDGINVARRDVQVELAARVGLDVRRFLERLDDPRTEMAVNDSADEAEEMGIKGAPALVIGGEWLVQGCRPLAEYRQVIDKYLRERVGPAVERLVH